jgi:hypothetical protein
LFCANYNKGDFMGFIFGVVKFTTGATIGAAVGAAVATFIVTRDGGQTIEQLRGIVNDVLAGGREAYDAEEARMQARHKQLIGDSATNRQLKKDEKKSEGK